MQMILFLETWDLPEDKTMKLDYKKFSKRLDQWLSANPIVGMVLAPIIIAFVLTVLAAKEGYVGLRIVGISLAFLLISTLSAVQITRIGGLLIKRLQNVRSYIKDKSVKRPPASTLLSIIHLLPEKPRKCLEQEISDMRLEYYEALAEKNVLHARCIVISYYTGIGWSSVVWTAERIKELIGFMPKVN